jgi:membrane protease subunit HflK
MAWNEPGGGGNKDPWSGKGGDRGGPPDLDDLLRKFQDKVSGIFGGNNKPPSGGGSRTPGSNKNGLAGVSLIIIMLALVWLASGIYIVEPAERGVITRFGAYLTITEPGPHWHLPFPIERVVIVNVDQISSSRHKAQMLTQDENIVDIELTVQSRIQDPVAYLFQDNNPKKTLQDATETIIRETIGKSELYFILTEGRSAVADRIRQGTQALIDTQYKTGLLVTSVNMQPAKPPEQVKSAFDDAIKAREDKERAENKARGYANGIVPVARGNAARVLADANAYRARVIAEAEGDASRFLAILGEYEKAPEVTRRRMYLDTMQTVLAANPKVMVDIKTSNNILYLPLDGLHKRPILPVLPQQIPQEEDSAPVEQTNSQMRDTVRARTVRP